MSKGKIRVELKDERGMRLTKEHGFTIEEGDGKVLAFDLIENEDYGISLLFGDQVFFLKFWDSGDLDKAESIVKRAVFEERMRRHGDSRSRPGQK